MTHDEPDNSYVRIVEDEDGGKWLDYPDKPFTIKRDLTCHHCGYNLTGLQSDHRCPECGAPIAVSLAENTIVVTDPYWVKRISRGAKLMIEVPMATGLPFLLFGLVWLVPEKYRRIPALIALGIVGLSLMIAFAAAVFGIWLFTTPHPRISMVRNRLVRPAIRFASVTIPLTAGAIALDLMLRIGIGWPWIAAIGAPFGIVGAIGAFAMCEYAIGMARHVFDEATARRIGQYRCGIMLGYACAAVTLTMAIYGGRSVNPTYAMTEIGFGIVAVTILFLFGALIYMSPHLLMKQLDHCVRASQWVWDKAMNEPHADDEAPHE